MIKKIFTRGYIFLILAFIYVPIFILVLYSFTDTKNIGTWNGFSVELYKDLFRNKMIMDAVKNTVILAFLSSILATILGTMGAMGIFYMKKRTGRLLEGLNQIPVINAEVVTAVSLALVFTLIFGGRSYGALLCGHILISAPFVVLSVIPKLKQMDPALYEAALDLGASPVRALFTVVIPEILPGIFSGFLLAITLSLDDYIITAFTKPSTMNTISTYVYGAVKNGKNSSVPALRALSAIIFLIIIVAVILLNVVKKKDKEKHE